MLKRYDVSKDEIVELTQDDFDELVKQINSISLYFQKNHPSEYQKWRETYFNKVKENV